MKLEQQDGGEDFARARELYLPFVDSKDARVRTAAAGILAKIRAISGDLGGLDDLRSALEQAELLDEPYRTRALADLHYAIGEVYGRVKKDHVEAAEHIEKSLLLSKNEIGERDLERLHCSYDWLMGCYRRLRKFESSLQMAQACYDVALRAGMGAVVSVGLFQLAVSQCLAGRHYQALATLDSCLDAAKTASSASPSLADIREWRVVALWYTGNPEAALEEMYEYYDACATEGVAHTQHMMLHTPPGEKWLEIFNAVGDVWLHVLALPPDVNADTIGRWREGLFRRKPHLRRHSNPLRIAPQDPSVRSTRKIGRNSLCPCGSGKKSKKCCYR